MVKALGAALPLTLHDQAHLMIAMSDNSASNMLIDAVGLDAVNAAIRDLGCTGTVLGRRFYGRAAHPGEPANRHVSAVSGMTRDPRACRSPGM